MPTVEGLTPSVLWTTLYGFIALCLLLTIVLTLAEKLRHWRDYKKLRTEAAKPGLADEISRKVLSELEPRFEEIEDKLKSDKNRLDNHERLIREVDTTSRDIRSALRAYGKTMVVILNHGSFGESKEVKEAADALSTFLAERL